MRHDLYMNEWNSIAKILVKGFMDIKYFPLRLCKAFIIHVLFGEVKKWSFYQIFNYVVTPMELKFVKAALRVIPPQIYDNNDFLDILDWFNCKSGVTIMNVYGIILEITKQESRQKPYIMLCSWRKCLSALKPLIWFI